MPAGHSSSNADEGIRLGNQLSRQGTARHSDPLIAALARYVEALDRRYPEGPAQMRQETLDGRANITGMSDRRKGTTS
jgi:hypothetical protein